MAAAFFLLGDSLHDAVNVCARNLKDTQLAVVIARVYGQKSPNTVSQVLQKHVVASSISTSDRWLGCWALCELREYADAMRMITVRRASRCELIWRYRYPSLQETLISARSSASYISIDYAAICKSRAWYL